MEIIKARIQDIPRMLELLKSVLLVHHKIRPDLFDNKLIKYQEDELKDLIKDDNCPCFVCLIDDYVVGYLISKIKYNRKVKSLYVDDLSVDEKYQHIGVGTRLLDYASNFAKQINCYNVLLTVWKGNDKAISFYQKNGLKTYKYSMEKIL